MWIGPAWVWAILAAVIPAVSSAVAATRMLYEYDRNRERFENTRLDLEYLQAFRAPSSRLTGAEYQVFRRLSAARSPL